MGARFKMLESQLSSTIFYVEVGIILEFYALQAVIVC
jgi:hypothetical protein